MKDVKIDRKKFIFKDLPSYTKWILENRLEEFVLLGIRCSREEELPLLKSLSHFSEEELVTLSLESYRLVLQALSENKVAPYIEQSIQRWLNNTLEIIDKDDIVMDDLALAAFIRRKMYRSFIEEYTSDRELEKRLLNEIDMYTSEEELVGYKAYISLQNNKVKKTQEEKKFQESLLLAAEELGETGSFLVDFKDRSKSLYTPQYERIFERPYRSAPENFVDFVHPDDRENYLASISKAFKEGGEYEVTYRYLINGKEKRIWSKGMCESENGSPVKIKGTIRDVTKRYELLEQLQESNELHKLAQEITHLGNWSWDIVTNKIIWSDEMYRIYGLKPQSEEITFERFISLIHPAYRENRVAEIQHSLKTQESPNYMLRIVTPAGEEKVLKGRGWVEVNHKNESVKLHGTCQDVTREFEMNKELLALNETLSKKNYELESINKELESFNYIASHDMQEPLRKTHTYIHRLLEDEETISEKGKGYIEKAIASVTRMQKLIRDLITFSQSTSVHAPFEKTELNRIIDEVRNSLSDQFEETNAHLRVDPLPHITAIPFQFTQLFTNLIGNAIKYRKEGVEPEIIVSSSLVDGRELNNPQYSGNGYLRIQITDNGIGFEPEQKEKIFDLFTRLHAKDQYSGTGIGLSICKKIVQHHNGFIEAESEKGKGSTFKIFLPAGSLLKLN